MRLACLFVIGMLLFLTGCKNKDSETQVCGVSVEFDGQFIRYCPDNENDNAVILKRPQDEFIWQAMNLFYYWQDEVAVLSDDRFEDYDALHSFLNTFSSSENLFDGLLHPDDRFSWIVEDYVALEQSFQGISESFGYEFGLLRIEENSDDLFGYVKYVVEGGPAANAGVSRGMLFNRVNGIQLTVGNYIDALFSTTSYELGLAEFQNENLVSSAASVSLTAVELSENPILLSKTIDANGLKVGYLVYNQFINSNQSHRELNSVFSNFLSEGISELVLDLRYNPGGSLTTARILSSMIYGKATNDTELGSIIYNTKLSQYFNSPIRFTSTLPIFNAAGEITSEELLNRLNISRVFVLTSGGTASASELLIAGLDPYIEVFTIGTTTVGKNVGSVTLYDSRSAGFLSNEVDVISDKHTYAIQPIISQLANSVGFTDYTDGLQPSIMVDERDYLASLSPLGDPQEPLLAEALAVIGGAARQNRSETRSFIPISFTAKSKERLQRINIEPAYLPQEIVNHNK